MKAILFDLDNTLIDFMKLKHVSCSRAIDAMIQAGLDLPRKKALEELYKIYDRYGIEDHTVFQKFLKKMTGEVDHKKLAYAIVAYRNARTGFLHPYPGTKTTLKKLKKKGIKLAIVSDAPKLKAHIRLAAMKLDFDVVVSAEDVGRKKPSRLPFRAALKQLNVKPEDCLMVGDRPPLDLKGAKSLGMKTCFAKYGYEGKVPKKFWDYEIEKIEELASLNLKFFI